MATYGNPPKPITPITPGRRVVGKDRQAYLTRMLAKKNISPAHRQRVQEELWGQGQFAWAPPTPEKLPFGTYDVGLDAQLRASKRGLGYTQEDIGTQLARLRDDYQSGQEQISQDYGRNTQQLGKNYANLRTGQMQGQRQANVSGGAYQQSQEKRAANQDWEQQALNTARDRMLASLTRDYQRSDMDLNTQLRRANLEGPEFEYDIGQAKLGQAKQYDPGLFAPPEPNNYVPPKKPPPKKKKKKK